MSFSSSYVLSGGGGTLPSQVTIAAPATAATINFAADNEGGKAVGQPLRHAGAVNSAAFSPNGKWVVTASDDNTAQVWEASSGRAVGPFLHHESSVSMAAFSPDGKWVVTASLDKTARVWEAASGKAVGQPLRHAAAVNSAAFSPDGKWVVTASEDATARVWEAASGKASGLPLRHEYVVYKAAFSRDGKWVVTASNDGTARVWETASGRAVGLPLHHRHDFDVKSAAFSRDGKWLVTASKDATARVWEVFVGSGKDSSLLAEAAEVISGYQLTDSGTPQPTDNASSRLHALHELADRAVVGELTAASFLKWYFSAPGERTISPGLKVPVCEYVRDLIKAGQFDEAEEEFPRYERFCGQ